MKDYYSILGLQPGASKDEIKKAYRELAQEHHPDKGGDETKFKEISEAYKALTDPSPNQQASGGDPSSEDIFESMFEDIFTHFGMGGHRRRKSQNLDAKVEVTLTVKEVYVGTSRNISFTRESLCSSCDGAGFPFKTCTTCNGLGTKSMMQHNVVIQSMCPTCRGKGKVDIKSSPCTSCSGQGKFRKQANETIQFPPGAGNLNQPVIMAVQGKGHTSSNHSGDLYVYIRVEPQPQFQQDGLNLVYTASIKFSDLCLGGKISVPLPDESNIQVKVPPGSDLYKTQRVRGKGFAQTSSPAKGDLLVKFKLTVPKKLTKEQKDLLEKLQECEL